MTARTHHIDRFGEDGEDKPAMQGGCWPYGGSGETEARQRLTDHLGSMGRIGRIIATYTHARAKQGPVLRLIGLATFLARRFKISSLSSPSSLKGWQHNEKTSEKESGQGVIILPV